LKNSSFTEIILINLQLGFVLAPVSNFLDFQRFAVQDFILIRESNAMFKIRANEQRIIINFRQILKMASKINQRPEIAPVPVTKLSHNLINFEQFNCEMFVIIFQKLKSLQSILFNTLPGHLCRHHSKNF
jgi:hypothetical protein